MGLYERVVLPWGIDKACGSKGFGKQRARLFAAHPVHGIVLEIGFGSGTNLPYLPVGVDRYLAVDPATSARKYADKRLTKHPINLEYVGLDGQSIDMDDASVDFVVSTMSLCTIPDPIAALHEARRILKPGGSLVFLEHGRSPAPKVASRQERFNGLQNRLFGGCNLNREIFSIIDQAGLQLSNTANFSMPGPKILGYMYSGRAVKN
jgi:ubiquinone/menaquinone biosynthesis C-methylase UbiE